MAQNMLAEVLKRYHILTNTPDMIEFNDELMEDFELIPQGIPALYEYSERIARDRRAAKNWVNAFLNLTSRHRGRLLDVSLVPLAFVAGYLSRPMISFMFSSVWETAGRIPQRTAPRRNHPSYTTKATQTNAPISDPSTESDSEQETVTFTVTEMVWINTITADLLRNQEESKIRQADMLTAIGDVEDKNESLRDNVTRLEIQHTLDEKNQRKLFNERESYRLGGKDLKEKWEKLQKEYNDLEDDRDELGEMVEKLGDDLKDMTVQRDELKQANGLLKIENEELETKATIDRDAAAEYEETCEDFNNDVSRQERELKAAAEEISQQKKELQEAAKETADLKARLAAVSEVSQEGLDDSESGLGTEEPKELESTVQATGSQVGVNEDTPKSSTQPMTLEQSKVEMRKLKKELDELKAVHHTSDASHDTSRGAIFEQPQGLNDNNVEEGAPLRRVQSAPLWLPPPHNDDDNDDDFNSLFDGSEYGDDDDHDDDVGHEGGDEGQGDQNGTHDSGDDSDNGSYQDETDVNEDGHDSRDNHESISDQDENHDNEGDDEDDGRDGGAEKVAIGAHQNGHDHVENTTPLPEDIPLPDTPPNDEQVPVVPEPSPRRVSPNLNVAAPAFVPASHQTPPAPFRAMGPEDTRNAHIKELNVGLKRLTWMEDKEGVPVADNVIDDMFDRQITQYLNFKPIDCARGSMWGALNHSPNRLDDAEEASTETQQNLIAHSSRSQEGDEEHEVSTPTKNDDDANEASMETQQNLDAHGSRSQEGLEEHDEDDGEWSDDEDDDHEENDGVVPMLGNYRVTRGPKDGQKDDVTLMLGNYKVTRGPEPVDHSSDESQKKPPVNTQKANGSASRAHCKSGTPKDEEESEAAGDWTDVEDGADEEVQDENSPEENEDMPMLGNYKVTRGNTPSDSDHKTPEAEKESAHDSSPPLACDTNTQETSRQDVTTPVQVPRFAGSSSPDSDVTNQAADAGESRASPQDVTTPVLDTTPKVRLPTPRLCGIDNQDSTPRVRLPQPPTRNQTQPAPVTPSTHTSTQEELDSSTSSPRAMFRQPPRTSEPPSTPANQGSPRQDGSVASPSRSDNSGMQDGNRAPPTGPAAGVPHWSPRGNERGGRGGRGAHQTHQNSAQNGPTNGAIPRGPAAANTINSSNTPVRQSGRGRGSGSAADSFRRFQERMAREKGS